jgi:hypothetical protein
MPSSQPRPPPPPPLELRGALCLGACLNALFAHAAQPRAAAHWSAPGVLHLSEALFRMDPLGLRGFGAPEDEYRGEAQLALAMAFGCQSREELFALEAAPVAPDHSPDALWALLRRSFQARTVWPTVLDPSLASSLRRALQLCDRRVGGERGA